MLHLLWKNRDEEVARRHHVIVTTRSQRSSSPREDFSPSPYNAANPSRHDTVTPPPSTRNKRTSTPPGRNYSPRSKSSSDGSWDTPTSSPPNSNSRPPHARGIGASNPRRKSAGKKESAQDITEPVYKNFWMCGFPDAFNFDRTWDCLHVNICLDAGFADSFNFENCKETLGSYIYYKYAHLRQEPGDNTTCWKRNLGFNE